MKKAINKLRQAMIGNTLFSAASGLSFIIFHAAIAEWMNIAEPKIILFLGIGLLLFCGMIVRLLPKTTVNQKGVYSIIIQDALWVLGSIVIIAFQLFDLSQNGFIAIAAIAVIVALFGFLQYIYLKQVISINN